MSFFHVGGGEANANGFHTDPAARTPPHSSVVMFMTDDHGAWATGAYGFREMHTPHIDRFAAEGVRSTDAFAWYGSLLAEPNDLHDR